jgi:hypothetical protein
MHMAAFDGTPVAGESRVEGLVARDRLDRVAAFACLPSRATDVAGG